MATLTDIWPSRTTPEAIQKSAKVVGVSIDGLNVNWMNQETMEHHHSNTATPSKGAANNIVDSRTRGYASKSKQVSEVQTAKG